MSDTEVLTGLKGFFGHPIKFIKTNLNYEFWQRFAKALLGPVAVMPAAGLFISIGRLFSQGFLGGFGITAPDSVILIGDILQNMGWFVIVNLGLFFALAIAGTWSNEKAWAVFTAAIMYFALNSVLVPMSKLIWGGIWDYNDWGNTNTGLVGSTLGIPTLKGSEVFGGIVIGFMAAHVLKKYETFDKMPKALSFFNGRRFVPIAAILYSVMIAFWFALIWPWVAQGINNVGKWLAEGSGFFYAPFIYGMGERLLLPFGLHHMITIPMNYTDLGGTYVTAFNNGNWSSISDWKPVFGQEPLWLAWTEDVMYIENVLGIKNWASLSTAELLVEIQNVMTPAEFAEWSAGLANLDNGAMTPLEALAEMQATVPARFKTGQVVISSAILPLAALGMWLALPKDNRKKAAPIYMSAALAVFICGITEPIEFIFVFTSPLLYVSYSVLSGFAFAFVDVMAQWGAPIRIHAFGMIEVISRAPIMLTTTLWTDFAWFWAYAAVFGGLSFTLFYLWTKYLNPLIPGMSSDSLVADVVGGTTPIAKTGSGSIGKPSGAKMKFTEKEIRLENITNGLGGANNIVNIDNCFTRLRITVRKPELVNKQILQKTGNSGIITKGTAVQIIVGGEAGVLKTNLVNFVQELGSDVHTNKTYGDDEALELKKQDEKLIKEHEHHIRKHK